MGIISSTSTLCTNAQATQQVVDYQNKFHVKLVVLYASPVATHGVALVGTDGTDVSMTLAFASGLEQWTKGYPASTLSISTEGSVYVYPSSITDTNIATPAIKCSGGTINSAICAAIVKAEGRQILEFYFDQATWSLPSTVFSIFWIQWVSNGLYAGVRRIEVNAQIDDLFMNTGEWDINTLEESETNTYRSTPADLIALKNYQTEVLTRLPAGSKIICTFPFNGQTVIENGGYQTDALFLQAKTMLDDFYWETHTFTHPYLDNLTYDEVSSELTQNVVTAQQLFGDDLDHPNYQPSSMITPSITGLFNGNALRAMWDQGIRYVVGDNSRPELVPKNVYNGFYTTTAVNGFDGIYIIPRHATNVFYDTSLPVYLLDLYNHLYKAYWGKDLTLEEVMHQEAIANVNHLLAYRIDPFMFHQANLHQFDYNGKKVSLLSLWLDAVFDRLALYSDLPIYSRGHDALGKMWQERDARDACGFSAKLKIDKDFKIFGMTGSSTNTCTYGITGATTTPSNTVSVEQYGPDSNIWIKLTPNTPFDINFINTIQA